MDDEQSRLQTLVRESLTTMCKSCVNYNGCISVEGMIAVTVDYDRVILIRLNESVQKYATAPPADATPSQPQLHLAQSDQSARRSNTTRVKKPLMTRTTFVSKPEYSSIEELDPLADNNDIILGLVEHESIDSKLFSNSLYAHSIMPPSRPHDEIPAGYSASSSIATPSPRQSQPDISDNPSHSFTAHPVYTKLKTSSDKEWSANRDIVEMIAKCVMRENGCFVTSRMLSRGYASYHKSQEIILGMQSICKPINDPLHIGLFRLVNDRTKVFYKCPPDQIPVSALDHFYMTLKQYTERYEQAPRRNKSMRDDRWGSYINSMKELSPYINKGGRTDYLLAKICWDDRNTNTALERELQLLNNSDILTLQKKFLDTNGCYVVITEMNERTQLKISQMKHVSKRSPSDPLYLGHYKCVNNKLHVFFKVPPMLISDRALEMFDMKREQYASLYKICYYFDSSVAVKVLPHWPFTRSDLPLDTFQITEDISQQIENSLATMCQKDADLVYDPPSKKKCKKNAADVMDIFSPIQCSTAGSSLPFELDLSNPIIAELTERAVVADDDAFDDELTAAVTDQRGVSTQNSNSLELCVVEVKKEFCSS